MKNYTWTIRQCICCGSNFSLVWKFWNQFDFYCPFSQINFDNKRQRKIKIKLVSKFSNQRKMSHNVYKYQETCSILMPANQVHETKFWMTAYCWILHSLSAVRSAFWFQLQEQDMELQFVMNSPWKYDWWSQDCHTHNSFRNSMLWHQFILDPLELSVKFTVYN